MENPNLDALNQYLNFMLGYEKVFCAVWFDSKTGFPFQGYGKGKHGKLPEFIDDYNRFMLTRDYKVPTLHITLNQLAVGYERASGKWESCRCICVDIDIPTTNLLINQYIQTHKPHLVVESSPCKYHLYWKLAPGFGGRYWQDNWTRTQSAFNYNLSGDLSMRSVAKIIRMPGFMRLTKDQQLFMPRIVFQSDIIDPISYADLPDRFPWFNRVSEEVDRHYVKQHKIITRDVLNHIKAGNTPIVLNNKVMVGDRNNTLYKYVYAYVKNTACTPAEAAAYAKKLLSTFETAYPMFEAAPTINSAYNSATSYLHKSKERALRLIGQIQAEEISNPLIETLS